LKRKYIINIVEVETEVEIEIDTFFVS